MSAANVAAAVSNILGALIAPVPILWQMEHGNIGTCAFAAWTSLGCFVSGINAILWRDGVSDYAPGWCDVASRITIGASVGLSSASVVITRRLYLGISLREVLLHEHEMRVRMVRDSCACVGIPCVVMALYYVVQERRYDIYEEFGCLHATANTVLTYVLMFAWPIMLGMYSTMMCPYIFHALLAQRKTMANIPSVLQSRMQRHFARLVALSFSIALLSLPAGFISAWVFARKGGTIVSWPGWSIIHSEIAHVSSFRKEIWVKNVATVIWLYWNQWQFVLAMALFFAFFGVTEEAREWYASFARRYVKTPTLDTHRRKRKNSIAPEAPISSPRSIVLDIRADSILTECSFSPVSPPQARKKLSYSPSSFLDLQLYDIHENTISSRSVDHASVVDLGYRHVVP